jgi:hypothetical protein
MSQRSTPCQTRARDRLRVLRWSVVVSTVGGELIDRDARHWQAWTLGGL